jgi:hypothetical protein
METKEIISIIGLFIVITGWIVSNYLAKRKELTLNALKWKKEQIDGQLEKFYGPIYAIFIENKGARDILRDVFNRDKLFKFGEKLSSEENSKYIEYLEKTLIPNNKKVVEIIKNNLHHVPSQDISANIIDFIKYTKKIEYIHSQMKLNGDTYGQHGYENYHADFQKEVMNMVEVLKKNQWTLINEK